MKVHYINILLLAIPLNILEHNKRNHNSTIYHTSNTKPIKPYRSLCECELYAPSNYEYNTEMNDVLKEFNDRIAQRFEEYNERMQEKRKQCKEKFEKDIQKIILKDKIEKELKEKIATLETNINPNDIPTCVCEKSVEDKVEKTCLKCGKNLGGLVPGMGLIGGTAVYGAAVNAATKAGIAKAIELMKGIFFLGEVSAINLDKLIHSGNYNHGMSLVNIVNKVSDTMCGVNEAAGDTKFCTFAYSFTLRKRSAFFTKTISENAEAAATEGIEAYGTTFVTETSPTTFLTNPYIASSIAIIIIVVILLIIYLILRYRRKKKMKRKLQYIKLLKE
ncbi:hypothetical protein PFTANZ_06222 [Plasmodium falciparum Tanzania (2000708)]|uniref:Surface antigen n=1 Tax=Plasmodium falciparum Tanzania (2000708) TaxID=1036725 RepID=A0A024VWH0_PLAFA|nr:hypothetical protein PFTANZ_06222 [Plasmodium falciparum Tanzania (2000708)]